MTDPAAQVIWHVPPEQVVPGAHAAPQAPQFRESDRNETQVPAQSTDSPRHSGAAPSEHAVASTQRATAATANRRIVPSALDEVGSTLADG